LPNRAFPDGITEQHLRTGTPLAEYTRWFMLFVLGAILLAALLGVFGGHKKPTVTAEGTAATLRVDAPAVLRNGEFFEMRVLIEPKAAVARPVIAVAQPYWRDITVNTMIPAPASESYEDGYFVLEFDPIEPGKAIEFKVDGQINPSLFGGTEGVVEARDGDRVLARVPLELRVLP